ncbi:MAG: bacterial Ig-like domain-containing protein [Clostridiales bacterium]|nr:bacterial Ig-like domain-containing protein [Clostridiales bacterium]
MLSLCMVLTMMPMATGVAWADSATSVTVGGVQMVNGSTTTYYKNGDTVSTGRRGTSTDYNAMYEPGTGSEPGTLTLNGLNLTSGGIKAVGDLTIVLVGENNIGNNYDGNCIKVETGDLTISGAGTLEAYNTNGVMSTIYAQNSMIINNGAKVTAIKAGGTAQAINAEGGDIVITDSATVVATNNGSYALLAGKINDSKNINVSNGATLIATSGTQAVKGNISLSGDLVVRAGTDSPGIILNIATNPFASTEKYVMIGPPKGLSSIAVTTPPTKTTYIAGNNFDTTGMVVTATYNDGSTATVDGYTVTDGNALTAGKTSVTISYTKGGVTKTTTQNITVNAPSNPGGYIPPVQKPVIGQNDNVKTELSSDGTKLTIKVADGYEITDVIVNGVSKGKVNELTGLKTGDKVEVKTEKKQEEPKEPTKEEIIAALDSSNLVARSKLITLKNGKKAVRITWYDKNGNEFDFDGVEIYRSTQRYKGYGLKPFYATKGGKTEGYYVNTRDLKEGTTYFYKVRGYVEIDGQKYYTDYSLKAIRTIK